MAKFEIHQSVMQQILYVTIVEAESIEDVKTGNYKVLEKLEPEYTGKECGTSNALCEYQEIVESNED